VVADRASAPLLCLSGAKTCFCLLAGALELAHPCRACGPLSVRLGLVQIVALAGVLSWWSHEEKLRPPTIMTLEELRESADVFAIEMLDIQAAHKTLYGDDVVSGITVPMNLHRVEVEHDLRTTLLRLRHHLLLTADGDDELKAVLGRSVTSVLTLFRHALIVLGETPPHAKPKVLEHAAEVFGFNVQPLRSVLELRSDGQHIDNVREIYYAYMDAILAVAHGLDVKVPKRQWHKHS